MATTPTAEQARRLQAEFVDSFDVNELSQFVQSAFGKPLDEFANTDTRSNAVSDLLGWVSRNGTWLELLTRAKAERPKRRTFVAICDETLDHLRADLPIGGVEPLRSVLLRRQLPFVDREEVRNALEEMARPDGRSGLVVVGSRKVGKTYCRQLLSFVQSAKWDDDRLAAFDLEQERDYTVPVVELARRLVRDIRRTDVAPPERLAGQSDDRWAADLAHWVAIEAESVPGRTWVVLDGFDHPDVLPATHRFVVKLAAETESRLRLRLVLLGYKEFDEAIERTVHRQPLTYLTGGQLKAFFDELDQQLGFRRNVGCAGAAEAADRLVAAFDGLPVGGEAHLEAVRKVVPAIVAELYRCARVAAGPIPPQQATQPPAGGSS